MVQAPKLEQLADVLLGQRSHAPAAIGPDHQPGRREPEQGLAHRRAAHPELRGQLAVAERLTWCEPAGHDGGAEGVEDLLGLLDKM